MADITLAGMAAPRQSAEQAAREWLKERGLLKDRKPFWIGEPEIKSLTALLESREREARIEELQTVPCDYVSDACMDYMVKRIAALKESPHAD